MAIQNDKQLVGVMGEALGTRYLIDKGYAILATNYQNPLGRRLGELDIIAEKDGQIVFVEVKTRLVRGTDMILPEQNITRDKLLKLEKIASHYLRQEKKERMPYRFDALAIILDREAKKAKIRHLESIFL